MARLEPLEFKLANGDTLIIRSMDADDASEQMEFRKQIARETTHTLQYPEMTSPPVSEISKRLQEILQSNVALQIGCFKDEKMVGGLFFTVENPNHLWIKHIGRFAMMIREDFWGLGIGSKLLSILDSHAISSGIKRIEAEVRVLNARGIQLYLKSGFKIEGTRQKSAFINGEFQDEYYIAKLFT